MNVENKLALALRTAALALLAVGAVGARSAGAQSGLVGVGTNGAASAALAAYENGGAVEFDLSSNADQTVIVDALSLAETFAAMTNGDDKGRDDKVVIRHLGRGRLADGEADPYDEAEGTPALDERYPTDDDAGTSRMVAFNGRSRNEFLITASSAHLARLSAEAERTGLNLESDAPGTRPTPGRGLALLADAVAEGAAPQSFSNGIDDRFRPYGNNAPVTQNVDKRRVQLGTGCTGTLVGPRHVVTAGHCLFNRASQTWSNNFTVRAGRNGSSSITSVLVNSASIPGGQALWYFAPWGWRNANNSNTDPFDIGILVLPGRLGDTTGWFGWWVLDAGTLQQQTISRAGYPLCAAVWNNAPRVDVPAVCSANHLYANSNPCSVANFINAKDGWSRNFDHSCDAGAGDSGSGLYLNYNNEGNGVVGVHFYSQCGKTVGADPVCTGDQIARPLRATRITPEYAGWISYFRSEFP